MQFSENFDDRNMTQKPIPLTRQQCEALIRKYGTGTDLWLRFWRYMGELGDKGATIEFIEASCAQLEKVWQEKIDETTTREKQNDTARK